MKLKKINVVQYYFNEMGADPELFFMQKLKKGFKVIESEKFLSEIPTHVDEDQYKGATHQSQNSTIKRDGVQLEFSTTPRQCRAYMADDFQALFQQLFDIIEEYPEITVKAEPLVTLKKKDMKEMSQDCLKLGCNPSLNAYSKTAEVTVKGEEYQYRAGGGHIHFAFSKKDIKTKKSQKDFAKVCDILVGNTCVLVDRHKGIPERRKVYGKAGEFRLPEHGFEYRTLSNFWLNDYKLMSLVFGLSRLAYSVYMSTKANKEADFVKELFALVNEKEIQQAINENDYDLALKNFEKIENWLNFNFQGTSHGMPFCTFKGTAPFKVFIEKPYTYWLGKDDLKSKWTDEIFNGHELGWENFEKETLSRLVKPRHKKLTEIKLPKGVLSPKDAKKGKKVQFTYVNYIGDKVTRKGVISTCPTLSKYISVKCDNDNNYSLIQKHGGYVYNGFYLEVRK